MPCQHQIPHLNALHERLFGKGLVVVGVTGGDAAEIEAYVKKNGVNYPIATGDSRVYGVKGIPAAFLIDPGGTLVWSGHPAELDETLLEKTLVGARAATLAAGLEEVGKAKDAGSFGAAYAKAKELLAGGRLSEEATAQANELLAECEQKVAAALDGAAKAKTDGDAFAAFLLLDPIAKGYAAVPRADEACQQLAALLADARQKREIQAGQKLLEVRALEQTREFDNAFKAYKALAQAFGGTRAARDATAAAAAIEKAGKLGYRKGCGACEAAGCACPAHRKKK